MNTERIEAALRTANDTAEVVIGAGVLSSVDEMFSRNFGDQPAVVVADENTFKVAGNAVQEQFEAAGRRTVDPYIFPVPADPACRISTYREARRIPPDP
jgi:glycerol-1-phosphate dehydrogenase [NAD(P)+]